MLKIPYFAKLYKSCIYLKYLKKFKLDEAFTNIAWDFREEDFSFKLFGQIKDRKVTFSSV